MKNRIFQQEWMALHPYESVASSDRYFLNLSNKILETIEEVAPKNFSPIITKNISLCVTSYFEDIISGLGLWQGFTRKHYQMYGKYLPFYSLDEDYLTDEINMEDICFIIWMTLQQEEIKNDVLINPENPLIAVLSDRIFTILDEEYETAPENENFRNYFDEKVDYDDYISLREVLAWLYYDSYLLSSSAEAVLEESLESMIDFIDDNPELSDMPTDVQAYTVFNDLVFDKTCGPLALKAHEWLAAIIGEESDRGKLLSEIKYRAVNTCYYRIKEMDDKTLTVFSSKDELISIDKDSFSQIPEMIMANIKCFTVGLLFYNGTWNINGVLIPVSTASFENDKFENIEEKERIKLAYDSFLKITDKPIHYISDSKELLDVFNEISADYFDVLSEGYNFAAYIDNDNEITIMPDIALFIKDKDNPYYDKEKAQKMGISLLTKYGLSRHIIEYLIKNNLLPDLRINSLLGEKRGKELVQDNMDFMFRFFQPEREIFKA